MGIGDSGLRGEGEGLPHSLGGLDPPPLHIKNIHHAITHAAVVEMVKTKCNLCCITIQPFAKDICRFFFFLATNVTKSQLKRFLHGRAIWLDRLCEEIEKR